MIPSRQFPRVSFGIIVLNGEPFTRYCLRSLYPFAHEIIVVEGAAPAAAAIATPDGHSIDGTLETLYRFRAEEDPEHKVQIITREGYWSEKDEQSRAYAERATGDWLWQVDIDEFYKPEDTQLVLEMLRDDPSITTVSFKTLTFWGGLDYIADGWYLRRGAAYYHRLFRWREGYCYITHRPPTVQDDLGRDLRELRWVTGQALARRGVLMYHYSLLFPKQVMEKCKYYGRAAWARRAGAERWAQENYLQLRYPFQVHNVPGYPSWLERFHGTHPPQIDAMNQDLSAGRLDIATRPMEDVNRLLRSPLYRFGCNWLKTMDYIDRGKLGLMAALRGYKRRWLTFAAK